MCGAYAHVWYGEGRGQIRGRKAQQKVMQERQSQMRAQVDYDEYLPGVHCDSHSVGECH